MQIGQVAKQRDVNFKWNCISERVLYLQPFPCSSFHSPLEHGVRDPGGNWHVDWGHIPEADLAIFSWWFSLFELQQEHWDQIAPRFNLRTSLFLKTWCWKGQAHGHSSFVVTASDEKRMVWNFENCDTRKHGRSQHKNPQCWTPKLSQQRWTCPTCSRLLNFSWAHESHTKNSGLLVAILWGRDSAVCCKLSSFRWCLTMGCVRWS